MKRKFTKFPSKITASTKPHPKIPVGWERVPEGDDDDGNWGTISKALPDNQGYYWINITEDDEGRRCFELEVGYRGDDGSIGKIWKAASKPFYRLGDIVKYADTKWRQLQNEYEEDIDACDSITASRYQPDICYRDRDNDDRVVALDAGMSDEAVEEMLAAHPSYYRSTLDSFNDIDACDKVTASSGIFYTDLGAGIGDKNQVFTEEELKAAFNSLLAEGDPIANSYDSFEAWRDATLDSGLLDVEFFEEDVENPDVEFDETEFDDVNSAINASTHRYSAGRIEEDGTEDFYYDTGFDSYDEACDWGTNHDCTHIYDRETDEFTPINSCDTKYFANMVSASNDPELDDDFLIEGYYDNQRRGLAESAETSDVSALNELANEYANKGYYIVVHNFTDGTITEFSADNWFDDIARDGGASLFMSW